MKNPLNFLEKHLRDGMKYPNGEPGYSTELYKDGNVQCIDIYTCPVYDSYKQFGQEEMRLFRRICCTYDYSVSELHVENGRYL